MRLFVTAALACALLACSTALALPPIPAYIKESLSDKPEYKAYVGQLAEAKDKCVSCHKPGLDKAKTKGHALNDFGQAMHKVLDDKGFMMAHKEKDAAKALKLFNEAWSKAIEEKNADGEKYGDLIRAGKLPGKNE